MSTFCLVALLVGFRVGDLVLGAAVGLALGALVALVGAGVGGAGGKVTRLILVLTYIHNTVPASDLGASHN